MQIFKSIFSGGTGSITVAEAKTQIDGTSKPYIIDVRQPSEYKSGHIANAKLMPLEKLTKDLNKLPKDREIICVCRSGARSGVAARQLKNAGFNAVNMRGGMISWQSAGYPIKRGK